MTNAEVFRAITGRRKYPRERRESDGGIHAESETEQNRAEDGGRPGLPVTSSALAAAMISTEMRLHGTPSALPPGWRRDVRDDRGIVGGKGKSVDLTEFEG